MKVKVGFIFDMIDYLFIIRKIELYLQSEIPKNIKGEKGVLMLTFLEIISQLVQFSAQCF